MSNIYSQVTIKNQTKNDVIVTIRGINVIKIPQKLIVKNFSLMKKSTIKLLSDTISVNGNTNGFPKLQNNERIPIALLDDSLPLAKIYDDRTRLLNCLYYLVYSENNSISTVI